MILIKKGITMLGLDAVRGLDEGDEMDLSGLARRFLSEVRKSPMKRSFSVIDIPLGYNGGKPQLKGMHVFVTIGVSETHVTIYGTDMEKRRHQVIDGGWGELRKYPISAKGNVVHLDTIEMIGAGLSGDLLLFGERPDLSGFQDFAAGWLHDLTSASLDKTVGLGAQYDAIIVQAMDFLEPALKTIVGLRPHLRLNIEEN